MSFDPVSFALGAASAKGGPGGASALSGLTDVDISNPSDGQTLVYNTTSGKWENGAGGGGGGVIINEVNNALDKTYAEIKTAYLDGRICLVYANGGYILVAAVLEDVEGSHYGVRSSNGTVYMTDSPSGYPATQK